MAVPGMAAQATTDEQKKEEEQVLAESRAKLEEEKRKNEALYAEAEELKQSAAQSPDAVQAVKDFTKKVDAAEVSTNQNLKTVGKDAGKVALGIVAVTAIMGGPAGIAALLVVALAWTLVSKSLNKPKATPEPEPSTTPQQDKDVIQATVPRPSSPTITATVTPKLTPAASNAQSSSQLKRQDWIELGRQNQAAPQFTFTNNQGKQSVISIAPRAPGDMMPTGGLSPQREDALRQAVQKLVEDQQAQALLDNDNQVANATLTVSDAAFNEKELQVIQEACTARKIEFKLDQVSAAEQEQDDAGIESSVGDASQKAASSTPGLGR